MDQAGSEVASDRSDPVSIPAWNQREATQHLQVTNPKLWSIEQPNLYRLVTRPSKPGVAPSTATKRPSAFAPFTSMRTRAFFSTASPSRSREPATTRTTPVWAAPCPTASSTYRIERLKEMGSNGYRTSHNPPTPELLDACDRLGMLVLDETRRFASDREGLSQLRRMIRRDRNHPSVVFWSTGNEEEEQGSERGARICASMKRLVRRLDPTRPITQAMNDDWGKGISAVLDVQGFNYKHAPEIDDFHAQFPAQPHVGTEEASTVSTRGIYANDKEKGYVSAYDREFSRVGVDRGRMVATYDQRAFLSGGFVWTGSTTAASPRLTVGPASTLTFLLMSAIHGLYHRHRGMRAQYADRSNRPQVSQ